MWFYLFGIPNKFFERFAYDATRQNQIKAFVKTLRKMGEITGEFEIDGKTIVSKYNTPVEIYL